MFFLNTFHEEYAVGVGYFLKYLKLQKFDLEQNQIKL
jgi:hypothetical protein